MSAAGRLGDALRWDGAPVSGERAAEPRSAALANYERLESCPGPHAFVLFRPRGVTSSRERYRCSRCGGECDAKALGWYRRGLMHGNLAVRGEQTP